MPTTVRQVLAHQAGLVVLDEAAPTEAFYDWDLMCHLLTEQAPVWEPGSALGESALFYGHLVGEAVRRVDGRSVGQFLRDEVSGPFGAGGWRKVPAVNGHGTARGVAGLYVALQQSRLLPPDAG